MSAAKLVITETTEFGTDTRSEEYGSWQIAAHQYGLAMDYWANRGTVRRVGEQKFTCTITNDHWATPETPHIAVVELVRL